MFTVGQKPDLITPLTDSTFGALVRCHKVGFLGERSKKHRKEADYVGQLRLHRKGCGAPVFLGTRAPRRRFAPWPRAHPNPGQSTGFKNIPGERGNHRATDRFRKPHTESPYLRWYNFV